MAEMMAGAALAQAAVSALRGVAGLTCVTEGKPVQAALPYLLVDAGTESDWSHKEGVGREVRLALTVHDAGEDRTRLRRLAAAADAAVATAADALQGWRLVSFVFLRSREVSAPRGGSALLLEYRARVLAG